ncbi:MAG TPA: polymerase [Cyanothece sp. UBA12306]|nr:polymerase [Cyanothece sp. UBA12306]
MVENSLKFGLFLLPFSADIGLASLIIALLIQWQQHYRQIIGYKPHRGLGILSLWLIITTIFANKPILALEGLPNFLPGIGLWAAFSLFFQSFSRLYQLAWWLVLTSIPLSGLGFAQLKWGWESPLFLRSIGIKLIAYGNPDGRMSSLLMYANILAMYLLINFILSLGLWIYHYGIWREKSSKKAILPLIILTLAVISNGVGLILTNSRSAWGLTLLAMMAFAFYLRWYWIIGIAMIAVGAVFWSAWVPWGQETMRQIVPAYFWARLTDELYDDRYVTALRTTQWQVAWQMMLEKPWLGWGLRNFTPVYQAKMNVWMGHPHNLFFMLLAEIGIPGTLLFCGLVGRVIFKGFRQLIEWSSQLGMKRNHLLLFTYLVAFSSCILFNCFDVTIFDVRVNLLGWFLLSALSGIIEVAKSEVRT